MLKSVDLCKCLRRHMFQISAQNYLLFRLDSQSRKWKEKLMHHVRPRRLSSEPYSVRYSLVSASDTQDYILCYLTASLKIINEQTNSHCVTCCVPRKLH
jgi:hypothetical protein